MGTNTVILGSTDQTGSPATPRVLVDSAGRLIPSPGATVQGVVGGVGVPVSSVAVQPIDRSGTVTAGGTAQVLMGANSNRQGFWFQNVSVGDLWISDVGTAAAAKPSLKVPSGGLYENPPNGVPVGAISVFGATTAQAFSAREW